MSSTPKNEPSPSPAPVEGVEHWQRLVREQQQTIEKLEGQLKTQQERIEQLETELRTRKKLKGKPKISPSQLNVKCQLHRRIILKVISTLFESMRSTIRNLKRRDRNSHEMTTMTLLY
jgi:septal ring factor EnvC (AmiA/AmiB activator)